MTLFKPNAAGLLLAGFAALSLISCGQKDKAEGPRSETSAQAAKANAASPLDKDFRLKKAEPLDVDAFFALMPEDSRPTYDSAAFDDKLGATVVNNLRLADANDGEGVTVERAEFYGVDLDAIGRIKSAQDAGEENPSTAMAQLAYGDPEKANGPFETVVQKVRLLNVATEGFDDGDTAAEIRIGGIELDQLEIRQGGLSPYGLSNMPAGIVNTLNIAGLYFKDISVNAEGGDAGAISFEAPDLRFVGIGGGKLDAVIANDFEYEMTQTAASRAAMSQSMGPQAGMLLSGPLGAFIAPENQRVKMKSFAWRGIDFSGLLPFGLSGEEPPLTDEKLIDLGTMTAADMETFIGGKRAAIVKEATVSAAEFTWLVPSKIRADSKGASYDFSAYVPDTEEAMLATIKEHGLDDVKGDGYVEWIWNADSGAADFDYVANMDGLADLSMAFGFAGLDLKEMAAAMEEGDSDAVSTQGAFKNFSFSIKDEKALDAIFALAALQMGGSGEDLRLSAPAMIRLSGAQVAQMNPRISNYVNAVADFVAKGGALEISAKPAKPVAFAEIESTGTTAPQTLPDVLGLEVTHKE